MEENYRMNKLAGISINESKSNKEKPLEAIEIIDRYEYLQKAFKFTLLYSKSNNAPYHNLNHLLTVVKYCYAGALSETELEKEDIKDLLIAAMFHDVDHSAGKKKDDKNVIEAKKAVSEFLRAEEIDSNEEVIHALLDATEYPYKTEGEELTLMQGIIRDADLMQVFEYNWIHQNIAGLSQELKMDFTEFIVPQRKFLEAAEFNTDWGKSMKKKRWSDVMKQFRMLENACQIKLKSE